MLTRTAVSLLVLTGCGATPARPETPVRCWPSDTNADFALACLPTSEFCVDDSQGVHRFPTVTSCQPLPAGCVSDHTCECLNLAFHCGVTSPCSVSSTGVLRVTCLPD